MPGVPSAKGCDACHKQKKKCDQVKPACSRCQRLQILCVGSGKQRFKFIVDHRSKHPPTPTSSKPASQIQSTPPKHVPSQTIITVPANEINFLTCELVNKLSTTADVKYDLSWTYGTFLQDIPSRLGTNEALDAAAAVLLDAHSDLCSRRPLKIFSLSVLSKYSRALRALRLCLSSPTKATEPETLCAVLLLIVCQCLITADRWNWSFHGEGAAQVLKFRGERPYKNDFEHKLVLTLRATVLIEALVNPKICVKPAEWRALMGKEFGGESNEARIMCCMACLPDIMQRGRVALYKGSGLEALVEETREQYEIARAIAENVLVTLEGLQATQESSHSDALARYIHAYVLRQYSLAVILCLVLNGLLRTLHSDDPDLDAESLHFCKRVLWIANEASIYRPLGASHVTPLLIVAWCCSRDEVVQESIEKALIDYEGDFGGEMTEKSKSELRYIRRRLHLEIDSNDHGLD